MQKINLIAQSVLELSHREKCGLQRRLRRLRQHPSGLNYSPRRKVFRRGQKREAYIVSIGSVEGNEADRIELITGEKYLQIIFIGDAELGNGLDDLGGNSGYLGHKLLQKVGSL